MAVPSAITDMSTTPGSNSPASSELVSTMDDYLRTLSAFIRQNYDSITTVSTNTTGAVIPRAAAGGSVDAITATYSPAVALTNDTTVLLEAAGANTSTTPTFAPNGLTAKTIVKGSGTALVAGDIPGANARVFLTYDSSLDKWVLLNPVYPVNIASDAEAIAGTSNATLITPLRLRGAFNATGTAPVYACRAWVNFNGTGTVTIRASGNVSSITDTGTGFYTVNFTTAMPDADYAVVSGMGGSPPADALVINYDGTGEVAPTTTAVRIAASLVGTDYRDQKYINVAIFR